MLKGAPAPMRIPAVLENKMHDIVIDERETARLAWWKIAWVDEIGTVLISILTGFLIISAVLLATGSNPLEVMAFAARMTLFTKLGLIQTLTLTSGLLLAALTFAVSMRCGLFNISAEGGLMIGAAATIAVGGLITAPPVLHHILIICAALLAGYLWSVPIAYLKIKRNVHEVVATIMTNFVALFLLGYLVVGPLRDPGESFGINAVTINESARFPIISSSLTAVIYLAVITAFVIHFVLWRTRFGMHIRAVGHDPDAAGAAGVQKNRMTYGAFGLGGAAAGLAGMALTAGLPPLWTVAEDLSALRGVGFLGIAVAMVGRNNPIACVLAAFFIAALRSSRISLQQFGVPPEITDLLVGVIILAFAAPSLFRGLCSFIFERQGAAK